MDLHGGDLIEALVAFTLFFRSGSVDQISPEMGKVFGIHFLVCGETRNSCAIEAQGVVLITVGLSADAGLAQAVKEKLAEEGSTVRIEAPRARCTPEPRGAALYRAYRRVLAHRAAVPA